jgi:cytochrome b
MFISWKTTFGAALVAAAYLAEQYQRAHVCAGWVHVAANWAFVVGIFAIGLFARDHNKTSEDHGIK